jgi:hypothetical protein
MGDWIMGGLIRRLAGWKQVKSAPASLPWSDGRRRRRVALRRRRWQNAP